MLSIAPVFCEPLVVMLRFSDRISWIAIQHLDRHLSQIANHYHKSNCKFMSCVITFCPGLYCPYWHSLNNSATPCGLAIYTHPFSRPLTQKDVHVSPLPARLPHPGVLGMTLNCIHIFIVTGSLLY